MTHTLKMKSEQSSLYGADVSGLIYGFKFIRAGKGQSVGAQEVLEGLQNSEDEDCFYWLHFNLAHSAAEKWMRDNLQLTDLFHESLRDGSRTTRVELDDDTLVAVVNDVSYDFDFEPSDISTLWLSVGSRLMVSARMQPLRSIDRLRDAVRRGATMRSTVELLVHLMHDQGDVLVNIVRSSTARVDEIEDRLLAGRLVTKRAKLGMLRRVLIRLQRLLAPEPAALFRLLRKPPEWIEEEDLQDLRQSTEEFNLALSDMAALQERIKLLQEDIAARVAEANNRSLFTLTIVTVLALPINMIAGLMGMNVGGIPWSEHPYGFWLVVAVVVSFTVIAGFIAYRHTRE